jgi:hypothetical protein
VRSLLASNSVRGQPEPIRRQLCELESLLLRPKKASRRVHDRECEKLTLNDVIGSNRDRGAVVAWRVADRAKAGRHFLRFR